MAKQTKVITRRKKFQEVEIPIIRSRIELIGNTIDEIKDKTIKLDLTRQLKGKSIEVTVKVKVENDKLVANPIKMKLMPYFIRRMIRKKISYVEDSFETPSQESMIIVKPFLITRKRVSRVVRKTLRNKTRNWLEDYISQKKDNELFNEILTNRMQKPLSLVLKKTYPLSLCEIRILEIKRPLEKEEVPEKIKETLVKVEESDEGILDQLKEIEDEKIRKAQEDIKETQEKAVKKEKEKVEEEKEEIKEIKKEVKMEKKEKTEKKEKVSSTSKKVETSKIEKEKEK